MLRQHKLYVRLSAALIACCGRWVALAQPIFESTAGMDPAFVSTLTKLDACVAAGAAKCGEEARLCAEAERLSAEEDTADGFVPGAGTSADAVATTEALQSCRLTLRSQAAATHAR